MFGRNSLRGCSFRQDGHQLVAHRLRGMHIVSSSQNTILTNQRFKPVHTSLVRTLIDAYLFRYFATQTDRSDKLVLTKTGSGGLSELKEVVDPSKASYAYVRVQYANDKESKREKFILVVWIGSGCKVMRKAKVCILYVPLVLIVPVVGGGCSPPRIVVQQA